MAENRTCSTCNKQKPLSEFDKVGANYRRRCRECLASAPNIPDLHTPVTYLINLHNHLMRRRSEDGSGFQWEITDQTILDLYSLQAGRCALTGLYLTYEGDRQGGEFNASIDRINPTLGYLPDNVRLVCKIVNVLRGRLTDTELLWWCKTIAAHMEHGAT